MTGCTSGSEELSVLERIAMQAAVEFLGRFIVATAAIDIGELVFVRNFLDVFMAGDTAIFAVNRILVVIPVDKNRNFLAIPLHGKITFTMAFHAFFVILRKRRLVGKKNC